MAAPFGGQVGPAIYTDSTIGGGARQGKTGELMVSEMQARYYENAYRKNIFLAYCAAQAMTVVGTGMVGLQVWNGSSGTNAVNLVLLKVGGDVVVTSATTTGIALATGTGQPAAPTGQTGATRVGSTFINSGVSPQALALAAGTFVNAPTATMVLMHNTAAIATTGEDPGFQIDLEGSIIIPPQCYVALAALGATGAAASVNSHLMWVEVPV